jgi:hypothetical protein
VRFSRGEKGYRARVRADERAPERELSDTSSVCKGVAQAAAVAVTLFPQPAPASLPASAPSAPLPRRPLEGQIDLAANGSWASHPRIARLSLGLMGGAAVGIGRFATPVLLTTLQVGVGRGFSFSAGFLFTQEKARAGPGETLLAVASGIAAICYHPFAYKRAFAGAFCSGVEVGAFTAAGDGYPTSREVHALWVAANPALVFAGHMLTTLSWLVRLDLHVPFNRYRLRVDGFGEVYDAAAVAGSLSVGAAWTFL